MKQTHTQDRPPAGSRSRMVDDAENHYVLVENKDRGEWETPLPNYLDMQSPIEGEGDLYTIASEDRKITGSGRLTLLRCSQAAHQAMLAETANASRGGVAAGTKDTGGDFDEVQGGHIGEGGAISLD